ncbi:MAG: hypothetical protein ACJAT4_001288 [Granulosicoccus sp.]|jgi:hypothetical protein
MINRLNSLNLGGGDLGNFIGWNARGTVIASVTKHLHIYLELLWSQNGDYLKADFYPDLNFSKAK